MTSLNPVRSVLVTGAGGNLGQKLITHLLTRDWCERIVALTARRRHPPRVWTGFSGSRPTWWIQSRRGGMKR